MKKIFFMGGLMLTCINLFSQTPQILADINPGGNAVSYKTTMFEMYGTGYFAANDGATGSELWKTDGTSAGTSMVSDIWPGANSSFPHAFGKIGTKLIFGATENPGLEKLYISDGTAAGTTPLKSISPYYNPASSIHLITSFGNSLVFIAEDGQHGAEPWITDGTEAGTTMIRDIDSITDHGSMDWTTTFTMLNNKFYFAATESVHGYELWVSDGTTAGTTLVKDINPGVADAFSYPTDITVSGGKLFFWADDGVHGTELWVSDGTTAGTQMVKDIKSGTSPSGNSMFEIAPYNGKVCFPADNGTTGRELWMSDGTAAGTQLIKDINPGNNYSDAKYFCEYNGKLYFSAYTNADGEQLWVTDGTTAGTFKAKDVYPGNLSQIFKTIVYNGRLYFTALTPTNGRQLFQYESSAGNLTVISPATITIDACAPGGYPSYPSLVNGSFFYPAAYETAKGTEFYKLTTQAGIAPSGKIPAISLFPNPAEGLVSLSADMEITSVRILDHLGRVVYQSTTAGMTSLVFDCTSFENELYLVEIKMDDRTVTEKLIVKH